MAHLILPFTPLSDNLRYNASSSKPYWLIKSLYKIYKTELRKNNIINSYRVPFKTSLERT